MVDKAGGGGWFISLHRIGAAEHVEYNCRQMCHMYACELHDGITYLETTLTMRYSSLVNVSELPERSKQVDAKNNESW